MMIKLKSRQPEDKKESETVLLLSEVIVTKLQDSTIM